MLFLLTSIQIDIVEMVIAISKDYDLFQELKKLLPKLNNEDKVARINDKLCCLDKTILETNFLYKLNNVNHREYDKPSLNRKDYFEWSSDGNFKRLHGLPYLIHSNGSRYWVNNNGLYHRENDLPRQISMNGHHEWRYNGVYLRKENNILQIYLFGIRIKNDSVWKSVFDYI